MIMQVIQVQDLKHRVYFTIVVLKKKSEAQARLPIVKKKFKNFFYFLYSQQWKKAAEK